MFTELQNQVWTTSATGVAISNNTDMSIDGSSRKIVWSEAGRTATVTFTSVNFSAYEELSLYIYLQDTLSTDLFTITVGGQVYTFQRSEFRRRHWNHILIDCSGLTTGTTLVFTNIATNLTLFVDYIGYRSVTYNCDVDIITALKAHINLDYDVSTTLATAATAGDMVVDLTRTTLQDYITDTSVIEIDNGAGTTEIVELIDKEGNLATPLTNSFSAGSTVEIICPVRSEDYDELEPDPICGIKVYDMNVEKQAEMIPIKNGSKVKEYLGALGIVIYIDCRNKKKLLQMSREYNRKYGKEFQFLLDGEQVEIYLDSSSFSDSIIGNNPRMAYYYKLEPQPYLLATGVAIDDLTINIGIASQDEAASETEIAIPFTTEVNAV